jgi:hypothetical protein
VLSDRPLCSLHRTVWGYLPPTPNRPPRHSSSPSPGGLLRVGIRVVTFGPMESEASRSGGPRSQWRRSLTLVVATTAIVYVVSALAMIMYTSGARDSKEYTLLIPAGTGAAIASGENPLEIPSTWTFQSGDLLTLVNKDASGHWLGGLWVLPGETASYTLRPSIAGIFSCSLHPAGEIVIDVEVSGFDWRLVMVPTLAVGPLLGLVAVAVRRVLSAIE